jgi:hypothetical protein
LFSDTFGNAFSVDADPTRQTAVSDLDIRHDLSVWSSYRIPTLMHQRIGKALTSDWTVAGFFNVRTGFPVNVNYTRAGNMFDEIIRPNVVAGVPLYTTINGIRAINTAAFSIPTNGQQGSLARNSLRGFPFRQIDLSLARRIRFRELSSLELKIQALNVFNRTNFADMESSLGTQFADGSFRPNYFFGQSVSTYGSGTFTPFYLYGGPRSLQLSAKFVF